jgi:glycosyltransferase involved in cell wall biosynthesis
MNILFLHTHGINPIAGGISRMTSVLASSLKKNKVEVFYLSVYKNSTTQYDINQYFFPDSTNLLSKDNTNYLLQIIKNKKIDILVNQATTNSQYSDISFTSKSLGVKVVSVIHNSILSPINNFPALKENKLIDLKLSWILPLIRNKCFISIIRKFYWFKYHNHYNKLQKRSDVVILVSKRNIPEFLYMIKDVRAKNVISISNAISLEKYHYEEKEKELLWVGTPDFSIKRLDLALRIWKLIEQKKTDWVFTVLGDSPYLNKAKNLAKSLKLNNVNFEGRQNPISYYKRAKFLCMTSATESFGLVLVEAMHYGVVPFAFDSFPAAKEIIENNVDGILIEAFDIDSYANVLLNLMNNSEKSKELALNCIEKSNFFNIDLIINDWILLFNKLINGEI